MLKLEIQIRPAWYYRPLSWVVSLLLTIPVIRFTTGKKVSTMSMGDLVFRTYPDPIEEITKL